MTLVGACRVGVSPTWFIHSLIKQELLSTTHQKTTDETTDTTDPINSEKTVGHDVTAAGPQSVVRLVREVASGLLWRGATV